MDFKNCRFARYVISITLLLEGIWFFFVWMWSMKFSSAAVIAAILLPVCSLVFLSVPPEKRAICTEKDLKLLNDMARCAFFIPAAYAVMMLLGAGRYLSDNFIETFLIYILLGQFALHVFAVLIFSALAVLAPREARKKPIRLAAAIYVVSTVMQMIIFPETVMLLSGR